MHKKIIVIFIAVILLLAGISAVTQEFDLSFLGLSGTEEEDFPTGFELNLNQVMGARWFRSNSGGMALEETQSRFTALRNEYALVIDYAYYDELPEQIIPYYNENLYSEIRILYKDGDSIRMQYIFRDENETTRLNAVFNEPDIGFIEIFDENSALQNEYMFFGSGEKNKIEYVYNENLLINTTYYSNNDADEFYKLYTDHYRYNRSFSLRYVERTFFTEMQLPQGEPVRFSYPRRAADALNSELFVIERLNLYPDYFGDVFVYLDSKIIYDTDERGRIISQTLYDEEDEIIWIIQNTWHYDRIISTVKTEGDTILLTEFSYDSDGNRTLERNLRNGELERVVSTEGNIDTEEIYINNILVLRAVWEDNIKISETRINN